MFRQTLFAAALALGVATQAAAHSGGHGAIAPEQALAVAVEATDYLTRTPVERDWSPLPQSWAALPASSAEVLANVDGDYVVAVTNAEGEIFYLLVAYNGVILDANFTGQFPYVYDVQNPEAD